MGAPVIWRGELENKLGYEQFKWKKRIVAMARFIDSCDKTVMDLGAGNMHLRGLLDENHIYVPVDYKKTAEDTVVCDFNKGEFPEIKADVIIAAGILDYINEPKWFLDKICETADKCVISYKGREKYPESLMDSEEIIEHMKKNGFVLTGKEEELEEWTLIGCFEKIIPSKMGKQLYCTGCGACVNACTNGALYMGTNEEGFYKPEFNKDKCTDCGRCVGVCPIGKRRLDSSDSINPDFYAVWAEDEIRMKSSSGGVFYELASYIIKNDGYVFGVRWDDNFNPITCDINNIDDLQPLMHSKYVQSNTGLTYKRVRELLNNKKYVLYVGTPCQIAGLKSFLGKDSESDYLYTVDLVCFGAPSNEVFHKYLQENYETDCIQDIVFRDKHAGKGWSPTGYSILMKNEKQIFPKFKNDYYQQAFHKALFRNDTCEKCEYYKLPRSGDFTLGDFWGINIYDKTWNDGKGTSIVLVNTAKAQNLFENLIPNFKRVEKVPMEWLLNRKNRILKKGRAGHPNRKYFTELLKKMPFNDAVKQSLSGYHDVGIVCMMNYNIGNNLTNYALYCTVKDLGYTAEMIDMPCDVKKSKRYSKKGALYYFLKNPYNAYDLFKPQNKYEAYENADNCGMYIVGPDQLWRDMFVVDKTDYFTTLDWVPSYKYKLSYGTSTGTSEYVASQADIAKMKLMLKRFNGISLRENYGQELLKGWGIDSTTVLDPVFICNRQYFDELAMRGGMRIPREKFVASYFLDPDIRKEQFVKKLSEKMTNGIYEVMTEPQCKEVPGSILEYTFEPGIEEWVAMIKHSEYVITDSFHGMCFALIYEKPFYVIFNRDCWRGYDRFVNLLSRLGLQCRILTGGTEDINYIEKIDYAKVNKCLGELKQNSLKWLISELEQGEKYWGISDNYDFYLESEYRRYKQKLKDIEENKFIRSNIFFQKHMVPNRQINRNECDKNMTVIGWGAGLCFRKNIEEISKYSEIKYVVDSNSELWGIRLTEDIVCISPADLLKFQNPFVLIMVENAGVAITISNTLLDMGISNFEHINNWLNEIRRDFND